ncbi:hypothetical protein D9M71_487160 [compost metagenome]
MLLFHLLRQLLGHFLGDFRRRVPTVFRGHLQALGIQHLGQFLFHQQAEVVALDGIAQQRQVVAVGVEARVPEVHLLPGHRALTATGQADGARAKVRPASGALGQLPQGQVPTGVGAAFLVEVQVKEDHRAYLQARVDHQVGQAHLAVGELRQADHAVEDGFELRVEHLLADAAVVVEHDGFHQLRLLQHAHRSTSGSTR